MTRVPRTISPGTRQSSAKPAPVATSRIGRSRGGARMPGFRALPGSRGLRIQVSSRKPRISPAVTASIAASTAAAPARMRVAWSSANCHSGIAASRRVAGVATREVRAGQSSPTNTSDARSANRTKASRYGLIGSRLAGRGHLPPALVEHQRGGALSREHEVDLGVDELVEEAARRFWIELQLLLSGRLGEQ